MVALLFSINTFAWFVFVTDGSTKIDADVISWDIAFLKDDVETEMIDIDITDLYPGMMTFEKEIMIMNRSDLDATFNCDIEKITVFGMDYENTDGNLMSSLQDQFPFKISFEYGESDIDKGGELTVKLVVKWDFENAQPYYKLNDLYEYQEGVTYYTLSNGEYTEEEVLGGSFNRLIKSGLYVESDDADTYWGERSVSYKEENPDDSVLHLQVKLVVSQRSS